MKQTVVHADSMESEVFQKHMEKRHRESLGGLTELRLTTAYLVQCYRSFHRKLHQFRPDLLHEHEDYETAK